MRWGRARTLTEAKRRKAQLVTDVARGEHVPRVALTVPEYGRQWIETYQGRTRKAIGEHTRAEYRERLEDAYEYFGEMRLATCEPQDVKAFAGVWSEAAAARGAGSGGKADLRPLSESNTVRMALAPVKAMFATAFEEGLIRSNPTAGVRIVVPRAACRVVDEDEGS
jgi:site-specific recombinase XerD